MGIRLSPEQRRRLERLMREKEERCGLCGSTDLRCDEDAATYIGGGFNVRVPGGTAARNVLAREWPNFDPYSPECVEGAFREVRMQDPA